MEEAKIKKELKKLNNIFKDIPENKKQLCSNLIKNASFLAIELEDLQKDIAENGAINTSKNGNGFVISQESPAHKSYISAMKMYSTIIKQLIDLLPDDKQDSISKAGESLAGFVAKGKKIELR